MHLVDFWLTMFSKVSCKRCIPEIVITMYAFKISHDCILSSKLVIFKMAFTIVKMHSTL